MGSMYLILGVCHRGHRMLYKQLWVSVKGMNPNYASIQLQHPSAMRDCPRTPSFTLQQFHTVPGMMQAGIQWSICTVMSDCFSRASNALSFVPVYIKCWRTNGSAVWYLYRSSMQCCGAQINRYIKCIQFCLIETFFSSCGCCLVTQCCNSLLCAGRYPCFLCVCL